MTYVWVVTGHTGVDEDRETWIEGAYATHEEAMGRVDHLNSRLIVLGCYDAWCDTLDVVRCDAMDDIMRGEDELFRVDYNGAHYSYEMVRRKKWGEL